MICPHCGRQNPDGSGVCAWCSHGLASNGEAESSTAPPAGGEEATVIVPAPAHDRTQVIAARSGEPAAGVDLGSRYRVVRLLGKGGMGAVYLVEDRELDRKVALKLIRPELVSDPGISARFKREIQLSSEVTHPNVLRVYDLGETEGARFLTMQYVEGQDLANLLKSGERLPLDRVLEIFRQIVEGLAAAHRKGVTHRDLKPQNVMVEHTGQVYLTDFGLAQSVNLTGLTETGALLGTPFYMSPEQVKGEKVDARSDIFSLGVLLYEMLAGRVPYSGNSVYQVMVQRLQRTPQPVRELCPDVPDYLVKILDKCLAVDPALRYRDASELLPDLERREVETSLVYELKRRRNWLRPIAYAIVAVLLAVAGFWFLRPGTDEATTAAVAEEALPVVGILPFQNRTGDSALDWVGEGLAQLVADNLSTSRHLRVVSMARVGALVRENPGDEPLREAAGGGGIEYLLSGELLPTGESVTLASRLVSTKGGEQVLSRRIDNLSRQGVLASSDEVARIVRQGLNLPLTSDVDVFAADFATRNPAAYEAYVKGLQALTDYHNDVAEERFRAALGLAPDFTMARYRLATVLATTGRMEAALEEIGRAVSEASRLPDRESRYVKAAEAWYNRRYDEALKDYQELVEAYPYETEARLFLAYVHSDLGQYEEEAAQLKTITELEPQMHTSWVALGGAYLRLGEFNQAVTTLMHYLELQPDNPNAYEMLGNAYRAQGEFDLACDEYRKALQRDPSFHYASHQMAVAQALQGDLEAAEASLAKLVEDGQVPPSLRIDAAFNLAYLRRARGRFSTAGKPLEALEKPIREEKVREAMALSVRGTSLLELGRFDEARQLIGRSVDRSPGVPTRYLFARGLLELKRGEVAAVRETAAKILEGSLPPGDPDRTEEKAAACLTGLALFQEGKASESIEPLTRAVALSGYEYGIYRLGLAEAYLRSGRLQEALAAARQASAPLDPVQPRLDLMLDRARASLVLARAQAALGRGQEASSLAAGFLLSWSGADPGLAEIRTAQELSGP